MGALLIIFVAVLSFLCGRLQVSVNALARRLEELETTFSGVECMGQFRDFNDVKE